MFRFIALETESIEVARTATFLQGQPPWVALNTDVFLVLKDPTCSVIRQTRTNRGASRLRTATREFSAESACESE